MQHIGAAAQHTRLSQVKSEPIPTRNDAPVKIVVSNSFEADVMHERCPYECP